MPIFSSICPSASVVSCPCSCPCPCPCPCSCSCPSRGSDRDRSTLSPAYHPPIPGPASSPSTPPIPSATTSPSPAPHQPPGSTHSYRFRKSASIAWYPSFVANGMSVVGCLYLAGRLVNGQRGICRSVQFFSLLARDRTCQSKKTH